MTALGLIAGLLTTICWIPQLVRSLRTRSTGDLSWGYLLALTAGVALWMVYGILRLDLAILVSNLFGLACLGTLIVIKALPGRPATGTPISPLLPRTAASAAADCPKEAA